MEAAVTADPTTPSHVSARRRAVIASTVGTTIEWYDFFLYGTVAALAFPTLFFPGVSPVNGVLLSFSTQFVGFAARPIGAAIFGHLGDRVGRKATLISTLLLMGIATALIGLLPTYSTLGIAAPLLLTVLRIVQGIGVGGEWGGSVLLSMEWGHQNRRGLLASMPQLGVPFGLLLSTAVVQLFGGASFISWGWRVPFLLSLVLVAVGLWVRLRVLESPEFAGVRERGQIEKQPVWAAIRRHPREILSSMFVRMSEQAPFYIFVTFVLAYGTGQLKIARSTLLNDVMIAAVAGLVTIPLAGYLSDRFGRRTVYGVGIVAVALYAFPYFGLLNTRAAGLVLLGMVLSLVVHGIMYGPQAALIAEAFGTNVRYSGAGLGYQLASVVAGGPAPLIAVAILSATHSSTWISWYIVGCAVVAMLALLAMPVPRKDVPVSQVDAAAAPA
jgi:MFS family permease